MKEVFPIVPATSGPLIVFGIVALALSSIIFLLASAPIIVFGLVTLVLFCLIFLFGSFAYASRHVKFEVSQEVWRSGEIFTGGASRPAPSCQGSPGRWT